MATRREDRPETGREDGFRSAELATRARLDALEADLREREATIEAMRAEAARLAAPSPLAGRVRQLEEAVQITERRYGALHDREAREIERLRRALQDAEAESARLRATAPAVTTREPPRPPGEEALRIRVRQLETAYREAQHEAETAKNAVAVLSEPKRDVDFGVLGLLVVGATVLGVLAALVRIVALVLAG